MGNKGNEVPRVPLEVV